MGWVGYGYSEHAYSTIFVIIISTSSQPHTHTHRLRGRATTNQVEGVGWGRVKWVLLVLFDAKEHLWSAMVQAVE